MKTIILLLLAGSMTLGASAQVFRPGVLNGAAAGAVVGAVIGNNSGGRHGAEGAAIGAVAGAMLGGISDEGRGGHSRGHVSVGWGTGGGHFGGGYRSYHGYHGYRHGPDIWFDAPLYFPYSYADPVWDDSGAYGYGSGDGATTGLLLGGLAGAIIGNNSGGRHGVAGALIGATLGSFIGASQDAQVAHSHRGYVAPRAEEPAPAATSSQAPQQVTIINNYYTTTPMSSANALFGRN